MNERIRQLRRTLDMTQQEFADKIGVKRNTVATYEMGRSVPSDAAIMLICQTFNVSEDWLRNGTGDMFLPSQADEISEICSKYGFDPYVESFLREYAKLPAQKRQVLKEYFENVVNSMSSPVSPNGLTAEEVYEKSLGLAPLPDASPSNLPGEDTGKSRKEA